MGVSGQGSQERRSRDGWAPLTREEERNLSSLVQNRDEDPELAAKALERLVLENLRLLWKIVGQFGTRELMREDLFQEGVVGLMRAAKLFDGRRGFKFSTYATPWITQAIRNAIEHTDRPIRISTHASDHRHLILNELAAGSTVDEIAAVLGLTRSLVAGVVQAEIPLLSLDAPLSGQEDDDRTFSSRVAARDSSPEDVALARVLLDEIGVDLDQVLRAELRKPYPSRLPQEVGGTPARYGLGVQLSPTLPISGSA